MLSAYAAGTWVLFIQTDKKSCAGYAQPAHIFYDRPVFSLIFRVGTGDIRKNRRRPPPSLPSRSLSKAQIYSRPTAARVAQS